MRPQRTAAPPPATSVQMRVRIGIRLQHLWCACTVLRRDKTVRARVKMVHASTGARRPVRWGAARRLVRAPRAPPKEVHARGCIISAARAQS